MKYVMALLAYLLLPLQAYGYELYTENWVEHFGKPLDEVYSTCAPGSSRMDDPTCDSLYADKHDWKDLMALPSNGALSATEEVLNRMSSCVQIRGVASFSAKGDCAALALVHGFDPNLDPAEQSEKNRKFHSLYLLRMHELVTLQRQVFLLEKHTDNVDPRLLYYMTQWYKMCEDARDKTPVPLIKEMCHMVEKVDADMDFAPPVLDVK